MLWLSPHLFLSVQRQVAVRDFFSCPADCSGLLVGLLALSICLHSFLETQPGQHWFHETTLLPLLEGIYTYIHYITLHYITLHYITLHYITLHYITLHYITLHYITLHYITLHYITLHYITYIYIYTYYIHIVNPEKKMIYNLLSCLFVGC